MKYKRILLKLSGESLAGESGKGLSTEVLDSYSQQIKKAVECGVQIGIVIGGGNIFRGLQGVGRGFDRVKGDQMGMLATIINSLALHSHLESLGTYSLEIRMSSYLLPLFITVCAEDVSFCHNKIPFLSRFTMLKVKIYLQYGVFLSVLFNY